MLPRRHRIPRRDFDAVFQRARWYRGVSFTAKILYDPTVTIPRFSCVIAKKNLSRAVDRHLMRRRVYDIASRLIPQLQPTTQAIFFFQNKKPTSLVDTEKEMLTLLRQSQSI
jgi:ribonuclease P protein component